MHILHSRHPTRKANVNDEINYKKKSKGSDLSCFLYACFAVCKQLVCKNLYMKNKKKFKK